MKTKHQGSKAAMSSRVGDQVHDTERKKPGHALFCLPGQRSCAKGFAQSRFQDFFHLPQLLLVVLSEAMEMAGKPVENPTFWMEMAEKTIEYPAF